MSASIVGRIFRSWLFGLTVSAIMAFCVIIGLRYAGLLQPIELALYDLHMQFRPTDRESESPVVLIRVYEKDIQQLKRYPLSDNVLANILEKLTQWQAKTIGVDIFRDIPDEGRERLRQVVTENPNIVMIQTLTGDNPVPPPAFINRQNQVGFADIKQDANGVIRRGLLMMWDADLTAQFSFSLQLALNYLQRNGITLSEDTEDSRNVKLNNMVIKRFQKNDGGYHRVDDGGYQFMLNYDRTPTGFPSWSIMDVLQGNNIDKNDIKDRVVIIGVTAESVQDQHETPLSSTGSSVRQMHGVEIHAHVVEQLINAALMDQSQMEVLSVNKAILWILILAILGAMTGMLLTQVYFLIIFGICAVIIILVIVQYSFDYYLWLPAVPWIFAYTVALVLAVALVRQNETSSRKLIMTMFGKFVTPEVADLLWQQRDQFLQGNQLRQQELTVTVLIADLQGYTSAIENMTPTNALAWSNIYIKMMTEQAINYSGFVDDYSGDSIKVNFGVPIPRKEAATIAVDARRAVDCAIEIGEQIEEINSKMKKNRLPQARLRIGIATGSVVAGHQGSSEHLKYTTLGDTVNTAARLESFDKGSFMREQNSCCRILAGEKTMFFLDVSYITEKIGEHHLKGRKQKIIISRIMRKTS